MYATLPTPHAVNEPRHNYRADSIKMLPFQLDAIDEAMQPHSTYMAEVVRLVTRIACMYNHDATSMHLNKLAREDFVALLTRLFSISGFGAALLPADLQEQLREAMAGGTEGASGRPISVNEPRTPYNHATTTVRGKPPNNSQ